MRAKVSAAAPLLALLPVDLARRVVGLDADQVGALLLRGLGRLLADVGTSAAPPPGGSGAAGASGFGSMDAERSLPPGSPESGATGDARRP